MGKAMWFMAGVGALALTACAQAPQGEAETPSDAATQGAEADQLAATSRSGRVRFVFATKEQGAEALTADDLFTENLQPMEIGIRAQNPNATALDDFKAAYAADTMDWTDAQKDRLRAAIESTLDALAPVEHALPDTVYLARAGRVVAGGLPHTRGQTIIFAGGALPQNEFQLTELFLHELHHVLSRHNPDAHDDYFRIVGYEPCAVTIPPATNERRLTNPDAPTYAHFVPTPDSAEDGVIPFLYATGPYRAGTETVLSDYFGFGLLAVEEEGGACTVTTALEDILNPAAIPAYGQAIGANTSYIIHPEETLADNFVFWAMKSEGLPNPEIPLAVGAFWSAYGK